MRRALALACAALALSAAPAFADPGIAFEVDGRDVTVSAAQLAAAADVAPTTYVVDGVAQSLTGTSVRAAVALAGADPNAVSAVTASADLALLQLTRPELGAVPPFPEGPALVWIDADGRTSLLRPATASGRAAQVIRSAPNAPLDVTIEGATLLEVAIIASVEKADVGQRVPLLAQSSTEDATYTWDFGDGTSEVGSEVDHAFARAGRYRVTVTVSDGAGGGGTSDPVTIVVGDPKRRTADAVRGTDTGRDSAAAPAPVPAAPAPAATPAPAPAAEPEVTPQATPKATQQKPRKRSKPKPDEPEQAPPKIDPDAVSGTLLADASTPESIAVQQAVVAASVPDTDGGFHVPPGLVVALAAAAALSLGAWAERRRR